MNMVQITVIQLVILNSVFIMFTKQSRNDVNLILKPTLNQIKENIANLITN